MGRCYALLFLLMFACIGCEWRLRLTDDQSETEIAVERYDRIQSLYLTTCDFSALQQMNINYPQQTRTLIEDVLCIGHVNDPEINVKFLSFYQDTTLQALIASAEQQYANMDDINQQLSEAFQRLRELLPQIEKPVVYAQIGSLDQSVIVGNGLLGISLDKYLGSDFPLYQREEYGYTDEQLKVMTRQYIVPDCIGFYLLSLYPIPNDSKLSRFETDMHIGKVQWVVNQAMNKTFFNTLYTRNVGYFMKKNPNITVDEMLRSKRLYDLPSK
jgi:hypothetical protein